MPWWRARCSLLLAADLRTASSLPDGRVRVDQRVRNLQQRH
jgi:hypothetical protein